MRKFGNLGGRALLFLGLAMCWGAGTAAAQMVQQVAVGVCQSSDDAKEFEFSGASFLVPSNMAGGADFVCPIEGVAAPPMNISSVSVFLGDPSVVEDARVELCFTDLDSTPAEICGKPAYSVGSGYFSQAVKASPPAPPPGKDTTAFIRIHIPQPNPPGYGFLRGFRVD